MLTKDNIKNKFKIIFIFLIIILITSIIGFSLSAKLDNDVEVEFNSELIYYLEVTYDGVDKYGLESNDNTRSEITSDYIYIEDKLPEGLIFNGFVTTSDNTFGAVSRDDSSNVCSGAVIDDGLTSNDKRQFIWKDWDGSTLSIFETNWGEFLSSDIIGIEPTRDGYTFERWSEPSYDKNLNIIYNAIYKEDSIEYKVEWYDIEEEMIKDSEIRRGISGKEVSVTASDKIINGYTFDENNLGNILSTILTPQSNELRLYFRSPDQLTSKIYKETIPNEDYKYNYHGLRYDENTRTISFKVKNLQAGCKLTIGIKTITPQTVDDPETKEVEQRRDFYNFGIANEKDSTKLSNTVHAWMGKDNVPLYNVNYEYTGEIPDNAPALPQAMSYAQNTSVNVALIPILEGYNFTGWTTEDINVSDNKFIMPNHNITFKGSFSKRDIYNVSYEIEGNIPEGYIIPQEKSYYPDSFVKLDSLTEGDIFNGYRFLGWKSTEVIINDDQTFIMPEKNIVIKGSFEPVTYKVEYRFYDTVLPPNSDTLLPISKEYHPGEKVTLDYPNSVAGYKFLGWYKDSQFIMPNNDVIVYGEWKIQNGTFIPTIEKEIINNQDYYRPGDIVYYNITITNNADYPIKNVMVEEKNKRAEFYKKVLSCLADTTNPCVEDYIIKTINLVEIPSIDPHSSIEIPSKYIVSEDDQGIIDNEVEIIGALADNYYELDTTIDYTDTASINIQSHLQICKEINSNDLKTFQFHITDNDSYDSWINLSNNECTTIYLKPNSYKISEVIPQEYTLKEITLSNENNTTKINNNDLINIELGQNYKINFKNSYRKKGFYHSDGRVENKVRNEHIQIYIDIEDYSKEYDGLDNYEMTYFISNQEYENLFELIPPDGPFINVGTYEINPKVVWKDGVDKSKYELNINKGELIINKRNITIRSGTSTKEYDSYPLTNDECVVVSGSFASKDTYRCITNGSQSNVGTSSNTFNIIFSNPEVESNYTITKIFGKLTVTSMLPRYSVIYKDGADGLVFGDLKYGNLKEESETPDYNGYLERTGYTFMGWAPTVNPKISSSDADENNEIIYIATWIKN